MKNPRIVHVGCFDWRYRNGRLECRVNPWNEWFEDAMTPEDHEAIANLRDHPTEDDGEEGEAAA